MTREEVYNTCVEIINTGENRFSVGRQLLPKHAIDAIIDCAVEEAIERIKYMTFATIDGRTGLPITKAKYVEGGEQR